VGEFTVKVKGQPTKGPDASNEFKVSVEKKQLWGMDGDVRRLQLAASARAPVGRASEEEPQYLIKSEKTDHQAMSRANREVLPCGPKTHCKT